MVRCDGGFGPPSPPLRRPTAHDTAPCHSLHFQWLLCLGVLPIAHGSMWVWGCPHPTPRFYRPWLGGGLGKMPCTIPVATAHGSVWAWGKCPARSVLPLPQVRCGLGENALSDPCFHCPWLAVLTFSKENIHKNLSLFYQECCASS